MLTITVNNRIRIPTNTLPTWVVRTLCDACTHTNPKYAKQKAFGYSTKGEQALIATWEEDGDELQLPRGVLPKVREVLDESGVPYRVVSAVNEGERYQFPEHRLPGGFELAPFQVEAIARILRRQQCIVRSPTGSGKTTIAIASIAAIGRTTLIVVWSGGLLKQWNDRLLKELPGLDSRDIGIMGMGRKPKLRPITIAMQQSIYAALKRNDAFAEELRHYFGVVVCDELQKFAAPTMFGSVDPLACRYRVGFSADETRADGKEFLIYDLFGRIEVDISQDDLISLGFVHDVEVRVVPTEFRADWYVEQKEAVVSGKTAARGRWGKPQIDFGRLLDEMSTDEQRNALVLRTIKDATAEGGALAIAHRVEHCQTLDRECVRAGVQSGLMLGTAKWMAAFEATRVGLETGRLRVGIGTLQALGQAIDIPAVARGVLVTPLVNNRQQFGQVRGRLCRPDRSGASGKHDAALYVMWDQYVYGLRALENLTRWNNRVVVLVDGNRWMPAKEFIRERRRAARNQQTFNMSEED